MTLENSVLSVTMRDERTVVLGRQTDDGTEGQAAHAS